MLSEKINRYRSFFGDSPCTVFRDETGDAADSDEAVLAELKRIDSCFVDEDTEGVREILKNAETDPELSAWDRLRIINECNSALLGLLRARSAGLGTPAQAETFS